MSLVLQCYLPSLVYCNSYPPYSIHNEKKQRPRYSGLSRHEDVVIVEYPVLQGSLSIMLFQRTGLG